MKNFNKKILIIAIIFLTDFNAYPMGTEPIIAALDSLINSISTSTSSISSINNFDTIPYNATAETAAEKLVLQTTTYENKIMLDVNYYDKETGVTVHAEKQLYPDNSLDNHNTIDGDFSLPSENDISQTSNTADNIPQETDTLNDLLKESAQDARRQETGENSATQSNHTIKEQQKVIREQDLQKDRVYFLSDFAGIPLDSDLILKKPDNFYDPRSALSSPIIAARMDRLITFYTYKTNLNSTFQSELDFCKALRSGKVVELLNHIYDSPLPSAQAAFDELKNIWICERKHMFLIHNSYNKRELDFMTQLGIDIMMKAERALITRPDYIAKHADTHSLKTIQEYKKNCIQLQQKGNRDALAKEVERLQSIAKKRSDFATKISLAIAKKTYFDPATTALHKISHAPSLSKACNYVKNLEFQLLIQAHQHNILDENHMRAWTSEHYGFDLLEAAHNCYKSRADYIYKPENQSYLSDTIKPILDNIESKNLPGAHAELVHLKKQIDKALAELNITDPIAQKEYIKKTVGRDVLELAQKKYEARTDHKQLVESFVDIDVDQASATILENNNTYESVAHEMSDLAERIFGNARLCNLSNLPTIESHVYDSIEAMRIAQDQPTFIFNFSMVNHTLGDIQQLAHAILSGTHPIMQRSSELLIEGFEAFLKGLNPVTQVSNMAHLASELGSFLEKGGTALWNDPITAMHNGISTTCRMVDLIRKTADFTSDLTVGRLYLPPEEYKQRTDAFCAMMEPLQGITLQHCFTFIGQLAADVVITKGLGTAYTLLKEIDALGKLGGSAARVAQTFKRGFDTHLADNPIVVTAEGIVLKMSNGMKDFNNGPREIINSAKALLESIYAPIAEILKAELKSIIDTLPKLPNGFGKCANEQIQISYMHILGLEINWTNKANELSKLSGFHHDLKCLIEQSGIIKFTRKTIDKNGCYSAILQMEGVRPIPKTFFPADWSRKQVIDKILEAYESFKSSGINARLTPDGKYEIVGLTKEGIEIKMHITQNGIIKSAYPIVNRFGV